MYAFGKSLCAWLIAVMYLLWLSRMATIYTSDRENGAHQRFQCIFHFSFLKLKHIAYNKQTRFRCTRFVVVFFHRVSLSIVWYHHRIAIISIQSSTTRFKHFSFRCNNNPSQHVLHMSIHPFEHIVCVLMVCSLRGGFGWASSRIERRKDVRARPRLNVHFTYVCAWPLFSCTIVTHYSAVSLPFHSHWCTKLVCNCQSSTCTHAYNANAITVHKVKLEETIEQNRMVCGCILHMHTVIRNCSRSKRTPA